MFKNVIFDWSGPIKDVSKSHLWIVNQIFKNMGGRELSSAELKENWEEPYMKFWSRYFPKMTIEQELKIYGDAIKSPDCPISDVYPGMAGLIKKIKAEGSFTAIISFDMPETIFPEIKRFGLIGCFNEIKTYVKDKEEVLRELLNKNNLDKDNTIFVGDGDHEMRSGNKNGIKTAAVLWGLCSEERLKATKPDFLIHNIKELEEILL